jgi:hypothetical protein
VSFVFPRNQVAHTDVLREAGIRSWRQNPDAFFWSATAAREQSLLVRGLRLADALAPLGRRTSPATQCRSSHFVRVNLGDALWRLHRERIASEARRLREHEALHLWWHPHNLGANPTRGAARIAELLDAVAARAPANVKFQSMGELS